LSACAMSGSSPRPTSSTSSSVAAKPAESKPAAPSATSAPAAPAAAAKPAEPARPSAPAPTSAPAAAKPAADSEASRQAAGAAAPVAQAKPASGAPAQPANAVVPPAPTPANPGNPSKPADPAPVIPAQTGRMVIYVTDIAVLVTNPSQLVNSLGDVATQAGGYVAGVENKDDGGVPLTSIKLKLPPDRYEPAMRQIRALAVEVTSEKATTQDVTEEFSDVQTQLASLEATHAQLLELLKRANTVEEILKIQEKVSQTKAQIDRLKGRETFLQRSSELATVTVNAKPAEEVLARTFSALRASVRRAEAQRSQTVKAIQVAKTPEEEATLRDRLGEANLELDRLNARVADIQAKAQAASITLPTAPPDEPVAAATTDEELLKEYMQLKGDRRLADLDVERLTREQAGTPEARAALIQAKLRVASLETKTKNLEERARRSGVTLPALSNDEINALAGVRNDSLWTRLNLGWALLAGLSVAVVGGLGLLIGRRFRRPPAGPAPATAA
jgi:hypothetical protein